MDASAEPAAPEPAAADPGVPVTIAPPADGKDWTWVLERACPDCGFDPGDHPYPSTGATLRASVPRWSAILADPLCVVRPRPGVWSPLEYGCHVRDVCAVFDRRLQDMTALDGARFDNWDQDSTALAGRYGENDPAVVAAQYASAAMALAARFERVPESLREHRGIRSNGSAFTVRTLALYFLHDIVHHLHDVDG